MGAFPIGTQIEKDGMRKEILGVLLGLGHSISPAGRDIYSSRGYFSIMEKGLTFDVYEEVTLDERERLSVESFVDCVLVYLDEVYAGKRPRLKVKGTEYRILTYEAPETILT